MPKSFQDLVKEAKKGIHEISVAELKEKIDQDEKFVLIDVRDKDEYREGYIPGAFSISRGTLEGSIAGAVPDHSQPLVLYCAGGFRSALAAKSLKEMGYGNVTHVAGGFGDWKQAGYGFVKDRALTQDQITRYGRHFMLKEVGEKGQIKLLESKVLLAGAGGLGSPAAVYLAAAGVGTLGIVDFDVVDLSNLQRQILHKTESVGRSKIESATETIRSLNPDVTVIPFEERLTSDNIMGILEDFDLVIDGCDNFPTRYLINDACVLSGKTNVHGSIFQFEGQVTVFKPGEGPCYRCLFPEPPPPGMVPNCAEAGVLGVLPGVIGIIQATEAIKLLLRKGEPLIGRLLVYESLEMKFRELKVRRNHDCPVCGDEPTVTELIDYEWFCGARQEAHV